MDEEAARRLIDELQRRRKTLRAGIGGVCAAVGGLIAVLFGADPLGWVPAAVAAVTGAAAWLYVDKNV